MSGPDGVQPVTWSRIRLHGFGRHGSLDVSFAPGLATLVAPNEFGKSTLVAGLAATVFGLPHVSDPTKFGRERYRGWGNPSRFDGEVTFVGRDGETYTLHRNFESHDVRIVRQASAGAVEIFDGTHNPNARTGTAPFEDLLERLVGMTDREAFQQSFSVGQPLPAPEQLGAEVQRLLSGSGQGTFRSGLERLSEAVTERTSATGDLGVTSRNLRKNRRLEELAEQIADLERALHEGRAAADRAKEVDEELDRLHSAKARLQAERRSLEDLVNAYGTWLSSKDAHVREMKEHRSLQEALGGVRLASGEIQTARARLSEEWPEFHEAGPELEQELTAARDAQRELARAEEMLTSARGSLDEALKAEANAVASREEHAVSAPEHHGSYEVEDLRELQSEASRALRDWERFRARRSDIAGRERELETYRAFETTDEQLLDLLRNYRYELDRRRRDAAEERRRALEVQTTPPSPERARPSGSLPAGLGRRLVVALVAALALAGLAYAVSASALIALAAAVVAGGLAYRLTPVRASDAPHPTGASGGAHAGEPVTAQRTLDTFLEATRPFVASFHAFEDPGDAVRTWEEGRRELERERRMQSEHAEREWGVRPDQVESLTPMTLAGSWGNLARYAHTQCKTSDTLPGLGSWLAQQDATTWEAAIGRAEASAKDRAAWQEQREEKDQTVVEAAAVRRQDEQAHARASEALERARQAEAAAQSEIEDLIARTDRTADELLARWREFREASQLVAGLESNLVARLKGRDADSIEELAECEYQAGMEVLRIANNVDELRAKHPELPQLTIDREDVAQRWREIDRAHRATAAKVDEVSGQIFEQAKTRSGLAGKELVNIARVEIEVRDLKAERAALEREIEALALAYRELQAAVTDFQANYRERLERAASEHIQRFSGAGARRVALGEDFAVTVVEPDGTEAHPSQLSQGTQDQLLLALRLAIADHLSDDAPLPLILDDPFLNWDETRLEQVEQALCGLAEERQVILLSHRRDFAEWGEAAELA